MKELDALLDRLWIVKEQDRELYNQVKNGIHKAKRFIEELLGYRLVVNSRLIKLEKKPGIPEAFMGIQDFTTILDYCILCLLLIFLEDKEEGEQFVLSEITEFIRANYSGIRSDNSDTDYDAPMELDWTLFTHRQSMIRVLKFAAYIYMIKLNDGSSEAFLHDTSNEVLYESTGVSRYFAVNFSRDIEGFENIDDFINSELLDQDADRGRIRINRVYRRLVMSPAAYWEHPDDQDYLYIKNQRGMIDNNLEKYTGGRLHVHKNGAFLLFSDEKSAKRTLPNTKAISDITLFMCRLINEEVRKGNLLKESNDFILINRNAFQALIYRLRKEYGSGWSKEYRELPFEKLCDQLEEYMESWSLLRPEKDRIIILPAAGKISGHYPQDYKDYKVSEGENENELEDK